MATKAADTLPARPGARDRSGLYVLAAAQGISGAGNGVANLAIPWFVLVTTGSPARMGIVAAVTAAAGMVAGFGGGAAVDRLGFQRASVLSDALSGLSVLLIPVLHGLGVLEFWHIVVLAGAGSVFDVPGNSARRSIVPALGRRAAIPTERANAVFELANSSSVTLVGPIVAGVLIGLLGAPGSLYVDAATFAIAIVLVGGVLPRLPRASRPVGTDTSYLREVADGFVHIVRDPVLRATLPVAIAFNMLLAPMVVLLAVIADQEFGSSGALAVFVASVGVGSTAGALGYGAIGHRLDRFRVLVVGTAGFAAGFTAFAIVDPLPLRAAVLVLAGLSAGPIQPVLSTLTNTRTPEALLGRVWAALAGISVVLAPLGALGGGVLIELTSAQTVLAIVVTGFWAMVVYEVFGPPMRRTATLFSDPVAEGGDP